MKMYDNQYGASFSETQLNPEVIAAGVADGSLIEREATFEDEMAECYRQRQLAYNEQCPIADQLDADWHARQGDPSKQQALDAAKAAIKAQFPKPAPPIAETTPSDPASTDTSSSTPSSPDTAQATTDPAPAPADPGTTP